MTEDLDNEEPTLKLPAEMTDSQKLDWVVETLQRFMARTTDRLPANYEARFTALEADIKDIKRDVALLREDIFNERRARADLSARVDALESRPN